MRRALAVLFILSILPLAGCGDNPPTPTAVVIVVTATPAPTQPPPTQAPDTATAVPPTPEPPSATPIPQTATPAPTETPEPPTATLAPALQEDAGPQVSPTPFASGGVGLAYQTWRARFGEPNRVAARFLQESFRHDDYIVTFWFGPQSDYPVSGIIRQVWPGTTLTRAAAQAEVRAILPADARPETQYTQADLQADLDLYPGSSIQMYYSPSLATRYVRRPDDWAPYGPWRHAKPGEFYVTYEAENNWDVFLGLPWELEQTLQARDEQGTAVARTPSP
jgi:hypothetical protein